MNRNTTAICAALLMCAIMFVFYGNLILNGNSISLADDRPGKVIYLTFDDGPSDRVTPKILDVLKEEKVKATFFIVGRNAERRKYLIEREIAEGHTVAVHSYSHKYKEIYASPKALIADIDKCNAVIKDITGKTSDLYRFPGGSYGLSDRLISAVTEHGMRYIDWNASTRDAELYRPTCEQIYKSAVAKDTLSDFVVLLAHDSTNKTATAEALRDIIKFYKDRNYAFAAF